MVVRLSQNLPHLNFIIGDVYGLYNMFFLDNIGAGLNLVNLEYHQSVVERHPTLVVNFAYLKDADNIDLFRIVGWMEKNKMNR